ncbi:MAG: hypothetical protein RPS47_05330 [Colwellia sp.]|jgi:hypothetical protein
MIAVIAHDAGGAEILSSYVLRNSLNCNYVLEGPARKIFERKLGSINIVSLDEAIKRSEWVLCGSSLPSSHELNAIKEARFHGKRSVVFLDHWINYSERFTRDNIKVLPDEIWVGDIMAERIAQKAFHNIDIFLKENPYFKDIQQKLDGLLVVEKNKNSLLFVSQPIRKHSSHFSNKSLDRGYTEEDALRYLLGNIDALDKQIDQIMIRLHPTESFDKYDWVKDEFNLPIIIDMEIDLLEAITKENVVVGMDSMAMVIGLLAKKKVICCIPPSGKACRLPHSDIIMLETLCN